MVGGAADSAGGGGGVRTGALTLAASEDDREFWATSTSAPSASAPPTAPAIKAFRLRRAPGMTIGGGVAEGSAAGFTSGSATSG